MRVQTYLMMLNIVHLAYLFYRARLLLWSALFFTGYGSSMCIMLFTPVLVKSFTFFLVMFYVQMMFISYTPVYIAHYWWVFYNEGFWQTTLMLMLYRFKM